MENFLKYRETGKIHLLLPQKSQKFPVPEVIAPTFRRGQ
jgi:hypothetical protein